MIFHRILNRIRRNLPKQLASRSAYELWSQDYPPIPHNRLMEIEQEAMLSLMPTFSDKCVIDLACGTGRYGLIAQKDARQVIGVDDSFAMLRKSQLHHSVLGSMTHIPLADMSVDVIVCGLAVGHSPDLNFIVQEIARVLVSGGYAVLSDFHSQQYLNGARRTFINNGTLYEVEHYPHELQDWQLACKQANLKIEDLLEPTITGNDIPVVMAIRLYKA